MDNRFVRFYDRKSNRHNWQIHRSVKAEHLEACKAAFINWRSGLAKKWHGLQLGYALGQPSPNVGEWCQLKCNDPSVIRYA